MRGFIPRLVSTLTMLFVGGLTMTACMAADMYPTDKKATLDEVDLVDEDIVDDDIEEMCLADTGETSSFRLFAGGKTGTQKETYEPNVDQQLLGICIRTPLGPGQVKLSGCTPAQLNDIAIMPEGGTVCTTPPANGTWYDSDGIYLRGRTGWLKVGNHCDAEITCLPTGGYTVASCCNACASVIKGRPAWTTDPHPAPTPF